MPHTHARTTDLLFGRVFLARHHGGAAGQRVVHGELLLQFADLALVLLDEQLKGRRE
jgi:hypothetical protein